MKAIWNGATIAESDTTVVIEGNHYFPPESVSMDLLEDSSASPTVCGWKGTADYYDVVVNGQTNQGAAWVYRDPKPEAKSIKGHIAFWKGVEVKA